MKILVIQQKMIGDVLTTSILFEALRIKYPKAELHYFINSNTFPVVENNPFIDKFIFFTPEIAANKWAFFQLIKSIRKERFDMVIDVYGKLSSNLMTFFSGARLKISQHKDYTSFIYTHTFKLKEQVKTVAGLAIENRMQLLQPIDESLSNKIFKPKIYLTHDEIDNAKKYLENAQIDLRKPLYMISVLGSDLNKTYPFESMAMVIDEIVLQTKGQILFNYIPAQKEDANAIFNLCQPATKEHIYMNVFGKRLREFLSITHFCDAVIGNEGGAINMAKALNVDTFTIFSPWIQKEAWNLFDNDTTNVSVHLKDFQPVLFVDQNKKGLKEIGQELYQQFHFEYFKNQLREFLKIHTNSNATSSN